VFIEDLNVTLDKEIASIQMLISSFIGETTIEGIDPYGVLKVYITVSLFAKHASPTSYISEELET
jgi:hypothetical protein